MVLNSLFENIKICLILFNRPVKGNKIIYNRNTKFDLINFELNCLFLKKKSLSYLYFREIKTPRTKTNDNNLIKTKKFMKNFNFSFTELH